MKKCMCCSKETDVYVVRTDSNNEDLILCSECESLFFNEFVDIQMEIILPDEIKRELDKKVIGQEYAKRILSFEIYKHILRIKNSNFIKLNKGNIMLIGPSGSGKTLLIKTLCDIVKLPFIEIDITSYTQVGYVGLNVSDIIKNLLKEANGDAKLAEFGIVFIDEIDKISKRTSSGDSKDVSGEGVQQNLLKMLEGTIVRIQNEDNETIEIDTKNILFIGGGAFTGIEEYIERRIKQKRFGFKEEESSSNKNMEKDNLRKYIKIDDVINYGILTEFIGRFPLIVSLNSLNKEELKKIAKIEIEREITNYFSLMGKSVKVNEKSIESIVSKCVNHPLGARAIRTNIHDMFKDSLYEFVMKDEKEIEI
ncbi:AAA family ATPase [Candidatus Arthromitus sp. SFB-turkey]|uniref:AAA family ATPase n=1 Tax=Candidatus Arthromitus sp. SFB-turkey TaxID=1840217 RepID=UPI000B0E81C9|nr:AAA family ATPase [Candidatus Arthromitus sp. SFB-turkey]